MIVKGRSDDQSWTGIPFKNIWAAAAARLQHVPVLFSSPFCPALLHTLFPFLLTFPLILLFVLFSLLCVGFLTMRPHALHFFRLITSSPAEFWIQSRNGADAVLLTSTKAQYSGYPLSHTVSLLSLMPFGQLGGRHLCRKKETCLTEHDLRWETLWRFFWVLLILNITNEAPSFSPAQTTSPHFFYTCICQLFPSHTTSCCVSALLTQPLNPQANLPNTEKIKICE